MKTPEAWAHYIVNPHTESPERIVERIQLDAWRQGMTDAAEKALDHRIWGRDQSARGFFDRIIAARDAKGETK